MKRLLLLVCLALSLTACGTEQDDLDAWMSEQTTRIAANAKIEDLPKPLKSEEFKYMAFESLAPFDLTKLNIAKAGGNRGLAPDTMRTKEPLEAYELDTLRMVASITKQGAVTAYVKTPDSTTQTVHVGNYMGQNFGRITSINESGITLREIIENSAGEWEARTKTIPLEEQEQKK